MADIQVANTDADLSGNTVVTEENTYTITGLHTYSRGSNAPFACISASAYVQYLDVDKLDGQEGAYYLAAANATGTLAVNRGGTGAATFTDGGVLLGSGTSAITATAVLGDGVILIGDASGDPTTLDVGSSSGITILGTIATGVWNGTAVAAAYGGTGQTSYTAGDLPYASGVAAISKLGIGANTNVLTSNGSIPQWSTRIDNTAMPTNVNLGGTLDVTGATTLDSTLSVDAGTASVIAEFISDTSDAAVIKLTNENSTTQTWGIGNAGVSHAAGDNTLYVRNETDGINTLIIATTGATTITNGATSGGTLDVLTLTTSSTNDIAPRLLMEANRNSVAQQIAIFVEASTSAGASMRFATDNTSGALTSAMVIDSSQNVGINQSTPTHKLHVVGDVKLQNSQVHLSDGYGLLWGDNGLNGNAATDSLRFDTAGGARLTIDSAGLVSIGNNLAVTGSVSKGSGSFKIDHPLPSKTDTHHLIHSFIEGPRADLIYRGSATLVAGSIIVDLDTAAGMTAGTWVLLCRDPQVFTSNESGWDAMRGSVSGSTLTIECQDAASTDTVSWMVVAERKDQHMYDTDWTDDEGHVIVEPEKPEP